MPVRAHSNHMLHLRNPACHPRLRESVRPDLVCTDSGLEEDLHKALVLLPVHDAVRMGGSHAPPRRSCPVSLCGLFSRCDVQLHCSIGDCAACRGCRCSFKCSCRGCFFKFSCAGFIGSFWSICVGCFLERWTSSFQVGPHVPASWRTGCIGCFVESKDALRANVGSKLSEAT